MGRYASIRQNKHKNERHEETNHHIGRLRPAGARIHYRNSRRHRRRAGRCPGGTRRRYGRHRRLFRHHRHRRGRHSAGCHLQREHGQRLHGGGGTPHDGLHRRGRHSHRGHTRHLLPCPRGRARAALLVHLQEPQAEVAPRRDGHGQGAAPARQSGTRAAGAGRAGVAQGHKEREHRLGPGLSLRFHGVGLGHRHSAVRGHLRRRPDGHRPHLGCEEARSAPRQGAARNPYRSEHGQATL